MADQSRADIGKRAATRGLSHRVGDRFWARMGALGRPATGFHSAPEPRTIGRYARGRQMLAGNFQFAGHLVESTPGGVALWDLPAPSVGFLLELHGCGWLDDLAAVGDAAARTAAQKAIADWIKRYGRGAGPGWLPDITGRRLIRWINNALFLLSGDGSTMSSAFFRSLAHQTGFLSRRWKSSAPGLPRFEALTGMIYAGLALQGMQKHVRPAMLALDSECAERIDMQGGLASRNPEELLEVFTLLTWAASALKENDITPMKAHLAAIERIAPTLRALRHADGGLARFHGGSRGEEGRLDQALAHAGVKPEPREGLVMGFARLSGGRTSIIADVAPPPVGTATPDAHASTLAFELTSARRPVIVNCGPGATFGEEWRRAGRATPSHSTLAIIGYSSSRLAARRTGPLQQEVLVEVPRSVTAKLQTEDSATTLLASHDGWRPTHGLTHLRYLELGLDGRGLIGMDTLAAQTPDDERRFNLALDESDGGAIAFAVRFHLHPEIEATLDMGGTAVSIVPRSGEIWVFRAGGADLSLEPSVYLERGRLKPRATKQIVLSGWAVEYATEVSWTLAKAQDLPGPVRDLTQDDLMSVS